MSAVPSCKVGRATVVVVTEGSVVTGVVTVDESPPDDAAMPVGNPSPGSMARITSLFEDEAAGFEAQQRDLKAAGVEKGSPMPNKNKVGKVTKAQIEEIAKTKVKDLTAANLEAAMKTVSGTARSMGIDVVE